MFAPRKAAETRAGEGPAAARSFETGQRSAASSDTFATARSESETSNGTAIARAASTRLGTTVAHSPEPASRPDVPFLQRRASIPSALEHEADEVARVAGATVAPLDALDRASSSEDSFGRQVASPLRERMEASLGWSLDAVRVHAGDAATMQAQSVGARAFARGSDVFFDAASFRPDTRAGVGLLAHELAHVRQQALGFAPRGGLQKKEDWDFTPAEYATLKKTKKDLRFNADSAWFPKALQENLVTTLKFALTSTKPVRTAGVNVKDFYHGHFVVPKDALKGDLADKRSEVEKKSQELQGKALGGDYFDAVTKKNLAAYTKAMQESEKLATPLLEQALKIEGAAVIYHTDESSGLGIKAGSPTRNIRTLIGGTPAGYDPSGKEADANLYLAEYREVLQFAFLVDESGVVHVTTGTTQNLSRVTGTPMG